MALNLQRNLRQPPTPEWSVLKKKKKKKYSLPSIASDLTSQPLQPVSPIDKVQMAHANKGPLVAVLSSPATTGNADKSIVVSFGFFEDPMR